jgi:hypothetical protein
VAAAAKHVSSLVIRDVLMVVVLVVVFVIHYISTLVVVGLPFPTPLSPSFVDAGRRSRRGACGVGG